MLLGHYRPGDKRIHRLQEDDLIILLNAGLALMELEREGIANRHGLELIREARADLERAILHARESVQERERYG